jgi:hypothetical protein
VQGGVEFVEEGRAKGVEGFGAIELDCGMLLVFMLP